MQKIYTFVQKRSFSSKMIAFPVCYFYLYWQMCILAQNLRIFNGNWLQKCILSRRKMHDDLIENCQKDAFLVRMNYLIVISYLHSIFVIVIICIFHSSFSNRCSVSRSTSWQDNVLLARLATLTAILLLRW